VCLSRAFTDLDPRLHFLDCGDRFLAPGGRALDASLMPDALHPSAAGYELLAQCLDPLVARLMQRPAGAGAGQAAGNGSQAA
jgi:lysophospholipase L1-like esterase